MELINKRYKVDYIYEQKQNTVVYRANDLLKNEQVNITVFNNNIKNNQLIEFIKANVNSITEIKCNNILRNMTFDLIDTVDNKQIQAKQYFYTSEYVDAKSIQEFDGVLTSREALEVMIKVCEIADYLYSRGKIYVDFKTNNILIHKDNDGVKIWLRDYLTANESNIVYILNNSKENSDKAKDNKKNRRSYMNNLSLIGRDILSFVQADREDQIFVGMVNIIKGLLFQNTYKEFKNLVDVLKALIKLKGDCNEKMFAYKYSLTHNAPMTGRNEYLEYLLHLNKERQNGINDVKLIKVHGLSGMGKTRFLKEISYRLRMEGSDVYSCKITESKKKLRPIIDMLKGMLNLCSNKLDSNNKHCLIKKYGNELIKIVPELRYFDEIKPEPLSMKKSSEFRLYNRILNFIIDFIEDKPTYIILDDVNYCDKHTIRLINYMVKGIKNSPLMFIISYNDECGIEGSENLKLIDDCGFDSKDIYDIQLTRFNLNETAEFIQDMLGMNYIPIKFAARIMNETKGNPSYIEEVIKNFYNSKELYIDENGFWEHNWQNYSMIKLSGDIQEAIEEQIKRLDDEQYSVLKCASVFKVPVTQKILAAVAQIDRKEIDIILEQLVNLKLMQKMVGDFGYTYDFNKMQTKRFMYQNIQKNERHRLHKKASEVLKHIYEVDLNFDYDEIIFHCVKSEDLDLALKYVIEFAKKMQDMLIISQAIELWSYAKELTEGVDHHLKREIIYNLAKLFYLQGYIEKCLTLSKEGLKLAESKQDDFYIINFENLIAEIYNSQNKFEEAKCMAYDAKERAAKICYIDGQLEATIIINRIYSSTGEFVGIFDYIDENIEFAKKYSRVNYIGHLYNQVGVVHILLGNINKGLDYIKEAIDYFEKCSNIEDILGYLIVLNNLAVVYDEYLNDPEISMHYFTKGLELSQEYSLVDNILNFYSNIAQMLIKQGEYLDALSYIDKLNESCSEYDVKYFDFIIGVSKAIIFFKTGEYIKCNKYIEMNNEQVKSTKIKWQDLNRYCMFLLEYYLKFRKWDKIIEVCDEFEADKNNKDNQITVEIFKEIAKVFSEKEDVKNLDEKIINCIDKMEADVSKRGILLKLAELFLLTDEKNKALNLLRLDTEISKTCVERAYDLENRYLGVLIGDNTEKELMDIKFEAKKRGINYMEATVDYFLGNIMFERNKYYEAINCYVNTLYIFERCALNIKDDEFRNSFLYNEIIDKTIVKFNDTLNNIYGENVQRDDIIANDIKQILKNPKLYEAIVRKRFKDKRMISSSIEDLISNFTVDHENNLNSILNYAIQISLAEKGFIAVKSEDSFEVIAKHNIGNIKENKYIQSVINYVNKVREPFQFDRTYSKVEKNVFRNQIDEEVTAIICIPIKEKNNVSFIKKERRKSSYNLENKIIGYLYIETDKLITRVNKNAKKLLAPLVSLSAVVLDNYLLKNRATTDKLTSIKNRECLDNSFDELLKNVNKGSVFSIIMADIDRFKNVNDQYGHQKGDEILKEIGKILLNSVRKNDIVGRYGGEEFLIILHNDDAETAIKIAEKIRKNVESRKLLGNDNSLTISLGVSTYPINGTYKEELIAKADQALYNAKNTGRNKTVSWNSTIQNTARLDKLTGIVTGNIVNDQRNALVLIEIVNLIKTNTTKENKIFLALGRLIEIVEAYQGMLITLDKDVSIDKVYARQRFTQGWIEDTNINYEIVDRIIRSKKGEFLIDWESINDKDLFLGNPNWQSVVVVPIIFEDNIRGVLQMSVPLNEKEFDYETYNFVKVVSDIMSSIL